MECPSSRRLSFIKCIGLLQTLLIRRKNRAEVRALKAQALRRNPRVQLMITPLLLNNLGSTKNHFPLPGTSCPERLPRLWFRPIPPSPAPGGDLVGRPGYERQYCRNTVATESHRKKNQFSLDMGCHEYQHSVHQEARRDTHFNSAKSHIGHWSNFETVLAITSPSFVRF